MTATGEQAVEWNARWPIWSTAHRDAVVEVIDSERLIDSGVVNRFEQEAARYFGANHAVGVSSGTVALTAALQATGIRPGDRVLVPAFGFSATALAVMHLGAVPVFCDIADQTNPAPRRYPPLTWCPDPAAWAHHAVKERCRAAIWVHMHGYPMDIRPEAAYLHDAREVVVIEDACQAPGATLPDGTKVGTLGVAGVFSLNENKPLWGAEGGLVVTDDPAVAARVRDLRFYGEDASMSDSPNRTWEAREMGWNWRLTDVSAALARVSLQQLDHWNGCARQNVERLCAAIDDAVPGSVMLRPAVVPGHAWHKMRVMVPGRLRDRLAARLNEAGIPTCRWQTMALPDMRAFARCPVAEGGVKHAQRAAEWSLVIGGEHFPPHAWPPVLVDPGWTKPLQSMFRAGHEQWYAKNQMTIMSERTYTP